MLQEGKLHVVRVPSLPRTAGILEPNFDRRHGKLQSVSKFFIETFEILFTQMPIFFPRRRANVLK